MTPEQKIEHGQNLYELQQKVSNLEADNARLTEALENLSDPYIYFTENGYSHEKASALSQSAPYLIRIARDVLQLP